MFFLYICKKTLRSIRTYATEKNMQPKRQTTGKPKKSPTLCKKFSPELPRNELPRRKNKDGSTKRIW